MLSETQNENRFLQFGIPADEEDEDEDEDEVDEEVDEDGQGNFDDVEGFADEAEDEDVDSSKPPPGKKELNET